MIHPGRVWRIAEMRNSYNLVFKDSMKGRIYLEDLGLDGRIILNCILKK
jgi:hypothetical protein